MKYSRIHLHKVSAAAPSKSARTLRAVKSKFSKARPNITPYAVSKTKSPFSRPFIRHPSPKSSISPPMVNDAKPSAVSAARANAANPSAFRNMSYLSDFEELNRGYVTFGGNPKGGKITGKGKINTGKLDFDDVYFVKELKFNLFRTREITRE
nr:hypothetical protein [Tanacetum cinerariifolium]